ncbi:TetR/AcrR family transcriptional regulator (plasmid) [Rhizobium leguminosarum]|jgi:TetR/AcrR family transcriptional repressor of nem operon|uniref:TetR family transcriptional regulator n=3 Tax=Rhizobium leguminosarum TaxID=384 RepID=A0A444IH31_RHILE|nr:TetR/AcrR family transcriptional regulator [Rhizobium leguminosarum]ASS58782.1 TetR/AcrR family transcriptional regulator [Rhizobium leguminosarum bv. viciae]AVC47235.1 bacterial regulatory, tetR family protein [Rhizobium leguminosarum bv. viciae]MBB4466477.1 TetR/AcrR family transcriptional repressor of nem operon [Rhizobium leguminosarum]MBB4473317.1 TetR/AcrR family transcriptional repressor of nem operon [Rhizobium leguminosarum]MBB4549757.1 TetR/AcrR family transcriptional repressor of
MMAKTKTDMREAVMSAARATVQAHGYNALSFRELAKEVGIKSASVHYHFPTKGALGAALARRYTEDGAAYLTELLATSENATWCMDRYTEIFRSALANDNRMCLCGIMSAELDDLPTEVRTEVDKFAAMNVGWLSKVLSRAKPSASDQDLQEHAMAIFAAIEGAQLVARGCQDIGIYDRTIRAYRATGLFP